MTTKKTTRIKPKPTQVTVDATEPNLQVSQTYQAFHCINNRGEHYFTHSKTELLKYLASINFTSVSILIEDVPYKFAY